MKDVVDRLKKDFKDSDYRHIYGEGFLNSSIATQIKVLREEREWTQARLAEEAGMNQSRISELEDVNFNSWTIRTLRKFAKAFDLRLKISFEEFGTLLHDFKGLNRKSLSRKSFAVDPAFKEPQPEPALKGTLASFLGTLDTNTLLVGQALEGHKGLTCSYLEAANAFASIVPQGKMSVGELLVSDYSRPVTTQQVGFGIQVVPRKPAANEVMQSVNQGAAA